MAAQEGVAILGIFVADLAFRAGRLPKIGETIAGSGFQMGPGGKGSNQAVAAARVGGGGKSGLHGRTVPGNARRERS